MAITVTALSVQIEVNKRSKPDVPPPKRPSRRR